MTIAHEVREPTGIAEKQQQCFDICKQSV